jgi:hypothetical protein
LRKSGEKMTAKLLEQSPAERNQDTAKQEDGMLEAVVRDKVLERLGQPAGNHRIQVKCVWGDNYRVNVFVGAGVAAFKIAHSYFLFADKDGKILNCSPPIARIY